MKSKHSGMYFSNLEWLKDVFQNEDVILADVSALEVLGLFSGYVNEEKIYVYAKKKGIYDNVDYRIIDDFDSVGYVIKSGIKCTSINQTFNDMLKNTDDIQALIEGLSNYYYENNETWNGLVIDDENLEKFKPLKEYAVDYFKG